MSHLENPAVYTTVAYCCLSFQYTVNSSINRLAKMKNDIISIVKYTMIVVDFSVGPYSYQP